MPSLLLIDDDEHVHESVEQPLSALIDEFHHARTPADGIRMALSEMPDVILLDVNMPKMDGLKVCRQLKQMASTRDTPILFLTIERKVDSLARAFDCGGADYIIKPFHAVELNARVAVAIRTKRAFDLLKEQARIDGLTGLANRAALDTSLSSAVASHERNGSVFSLLMIDLDHFKQINDTHGHGIGDETLRRVGATLRGCSRPYDLPCRFGGDEFLVLLGQTEHDKAVSAANRILALIGEISVPTSEGEFVPHVSAGLASSDDMPMGYCADDVLKAADEALYTAKHCGGQQLVVADQSDHTSETV